MGSYARGMLINCSRAWLKSHDIVDLVCSSERGKCWKALDVHVIRYILFKPRQRHTRDLARETDVLGVKIHGGTAENDSVVFTGV